MPWHLGGPEQLTYEELAAYLEHYRKKKEAEQREAKAQRKAAPRQGVSRGRRRR
jgi:hypothetical protein